METKPSNLSAQEALMTDDDLRNSSPFQWVARRYTPAVAERVLREFEGIVLSKLRAPVADELPEWAQISAKESCGEHLTPLERFVLDNEPAGDGDDKWRDQLAAALASATAAKDA